MARMASALLALSTAGLASGGRPNVVLVMCDDLDKLLGGETAIPQVRSLLGDGGATAKHYFVSSPKCTPSRSAWLSGRHYHNLRPNGATTGRGLNTSNFFDLDAIFPTMRRAGYLTAIFGKIHNDQAGWLCRPNNHTEPFDHIETECSPCGGYYRTGPNEWVHKETHDSIPYLETLYPSSPFSNYSEAQYGNRTIRWIKKVVAAGGGPFFAFIGTSGPHLGVVPAPWHRARTWEQTGVAPRTPNFNMQATGHHPLLATAPMLDEAGVAAVDQIFRDRWGALFSIDDMVAGIRTAVDDLGIGKNTYFMFTSDHGYHLGQFRIPDEKMMPYETDIRVPFFMSGPGIEPGTVVPELIANIDIAPTLCEIAGVTPPTIMDGRSLIPLVTGRKGSLPRPWRTHFMTEFAEGGFQEWGTNKYWGFDEHGPVVDLTLNPPYGPGCATHDACCGPDYSGLTQRGGNATGGGPCTNNPCAVASQCPAAGRVDYQYDDPTYNWRALRVMNATHNFTFVQFDPSYLFDSVEPDPPIKPSGYMVGVNLVGKDDPHPCPANPGASNNWTACKEVCRGKTGCVGWTLHLNAASGPISGWRCCTKTAVQSLVSAPPTTVSGLMNQSSVHSATRSAAPTTAPSTITFSEFYDVSADPWQIQNLWPSLSPSVQASLKAEITHRFACKGTRTAESTCE